jgi:RNA polymerase sigma factor (sigma-70 family)
VTSASGVAIEDLLRELTPEVLGALVRRHGRFDACEDAVQEALLAAATQWPADGVPDSPRGWLIAVANRRLVDHIRSESARRRREDATTSASSIDERFAPAADAPPVGEHDDTLALLFLCCHPQLSAPSQIALTLRAVGGLTTAEIARAFLVPEATMAQRISRAKQRIRDSGSQFAMPPNAERAERLRAVMQVLYLIFNEGYTASAGQRLHRGELTREAMRLTLTIHRLLPGDGEVAGLLALMLLTEARRPARTRPDGSLVPLAEQDRSRWDQDLIREGVALVSDALSNTRLGPYQIQAAIAAVHDEAPTVDETDWKQVLALYELLEQVSPNPMVTLNRAVAVTMVHGPDAGLDLLATLETDPRMARHHRLHAVRGHLRELAGDSASAVASYRTAARLSSNVPERRYLYAKAARLTSEPR